MLYHSIMAPYFDCNNMWQGALSVPCQKQHYGTMEPVRWMCLYNNVSFCVSV